MLARKTSPSIYTANISASKSLFIFLQNKSFLPYFQRMDAMYACLGIPISCKHFRIHCTQWGEYEVSSCAMLRVPRDWTACQVVGMGGWGRAKCTENGASIATYFATKIKRTNYIAIPASWQFCILLFISFYFTCRQRGLLLNLELQNPVSINKS